jgi:hypothetical protein
LLLCVMMMMNLRVIWRLIFVTSIVMYAPAAGPS